MLSPIPNAPSSATAAASTASPVGRTAAALLPLVVVARGAGFFVSMAVAAWYGVGATTDAWYWAQALPAVALVVASSAAATAITPHLAHLRVTDPRAEGRLIGGAATWAALVSGAACLPLCLLGPVVAARLTSFDATTQHLAVRFLWESLPLVALMSGSAVLRAACEVRARFRAVSLLPLFRAVATLLFLAASRGWLGVHALPWALTFGELTGVSIYVVLLRGMDVPLRFGIATGTGIRAVLGDLGLLLVGEILVALHLLADKGAAGLLVAGSVATLEFASRTRVIPQTLLEGTLVMVAFATWSRLRAESRTDEARHQMAASLRWTVSVAAPVLAGMFVARHVIVALMFQRGQFLAEDATRTASMLAWYLPGVLPTLLATLAMKALVVERKLEFIAVTGLVSLLLKIVLNLVFMRVLGVDGLALATTVGAFAIGFLYVRELGLGREGWGQSLPHVVVSVCVAAVVEMIGPPTSLTSPVLWIAAAALVAVLGAGVRRG